MKEADVAGGRRELPGTPDGLELRRDGPGHVLGIGRGTGLPAQLPEDVAPVVVEPADRGDGADDATRAKNPRRFPDRASRVGNQKQRSRVRDGVE